MDELATEQSDIEKELVAREVQRMKAEGRKVDDVDILTV
jgi:hypothetical protein